MPAIHALPAIFGAAGVVSGLPPYITSGSQYDGTNDSIIRDFSAGSGTSSSKFGTLSFWVNFNSGSDGNRHRIVALTGAAILCERTAANVFRIKGENSGGTTIMEMFSASTYLAAAGWINVMMAWDQVAGITQMYIDDIEDKSSTGVISSDSNIDYTVADIAIGAATNAAQKMAGDLSELNFHNVFVDLDVVANRRRFIRDTIKPEDPGSDGSVAMGVQPFVYLKTGSEINTGTTGNFTVNGALTAASTSPSD